MTILMNNGLNFPPRERAQHLLNKNVELENKRRKSAQARIPSDPNIWQQMRENYESIILEDHNFSEKHEIEYSLWQLHYRRIDELRAHLSTAMSSNGAHAGQNGKIATWPDRITKIRSQFKLFLSEATGFYHDLMLKIRSKYGLPLGYFSNDPDSQSVLLKDRDKSSEINKGLVSCHRCLIYLGDLSRYKVLYGDGDSKTKDFSAASSYYNQALSLWPSSGNPHHQLAIIDAYSGDELVAIYRYFRSLAVEFPFSTARDNLIISFEKNRQSYSQIIVELKTVSSKSSSARVIAKGRGKGDLNTHRKDSKSLLTKERKSSPAETFKNFSIRFVRLNGILFTRTSLETFGEVLHLVTEDLQELISHTAEGDCSFPSGTGDDRMLIVWLVTILIFSVHNVSREGENQAYVELLQRSVLLQNALTAIFEFMGCIIQGYTRLNGAPDDLILPGVLVFVEWLACRPDIAAGEDAEEKQASARLSFWNHFVAFLNGLLDNTVFHGKEEENESFFFAAIRNTESETTSQLALSEDFELRGFLPLLPAQMILDFSRKRTFVNSGSQREKTTRIKRIIAAAKALSGTVWFGRETLCFDEEGRFFVGITSQLSNDFIPPADSLEEIHALNDSIHAVVDHMSNFPTQCKLLVDDEDEDEVIVFKPTLMDKPPAPILPKNDAPKNDINVNTCASSFSANTGSSALSIITTTTSSTPLLSSNAYTISQQMQPIQKGNTSAEWIDNPQDSIYRGLNSLKLYEKSDLCEVEMAEKGPINFSESIGFASDIDLETMIPSKMDSVMMNGNAGKSPANHLLSMSSVLRKNPVQRPVRHFGPPPGFNGESVKQTEGLFSGISKNEDILLDDYSWLDGYKVPTFNGVGYDDSEVEMKGRSFLSGNDFNSIDPFSHHGNNTPPSSLYQIVQNNGDEPFVNHSKLNQPQSFERGNRHFTAARTGNHQGQSPWGNSFFV